MVALSAEPQHVGDVEVACPCGETIAVPVLCEFVPSGLTEHEVTLRCSPNTAPLVEHARAHRLSRTARP